MKHFFKIILILLAFNPITLSSQSISAYTFDGAGGFLVNNVKYEYSLGQISFAYTSDIINVQSGIFQQKVASSDTLKDNFNTVIISLYPNPVDDYFCITVNSTQNIEQIQISVFDVTGKQQTINSEINKINSTATVKSYTNNLQSGIYNCKIILNNTFSKNITLIKK